MYENIYLEEQCLNCCRKHLGQAYVLMLENSTGRYPTHFWKAIGHMACAEAHTIIKYTELSEAIEKERLAMMENSEYYARFDYLIELANNIAGGKKDITTNET